MSSTNFLKSGHWPTLLCSFLYFDVSFMVWVLMGALGAILTKDLNLSAGAKGFLVAVPILSGAFLRVPLGLLSDRVGGRRTGLCGLVLTLVPLLLGALWADSYSRLIVVGLLMGIAGASFSVALPLASRWYPPQYQGLAMGIAGAGNSGTVLAVLLAPLIARAWGWHTAFGLSAIPIGLVLILFLTVAKDSPSQPPPTSIRAYLRILAISDTYWFCILYSVTFGGFVGLASFLSMFFVDQYQMEPVQAGLFATLCSVAGSLLRPVGGYLADRFGGIRILATIFTLLIFLLLGMATLPSLNVATMFLFFIMAGLGMGNGSVFQLVPQRFQKEIGVVTGLVGAAGGVGGFLLPTWFGHIKQSTGSYTGGFLGLGLAAGGAILTLLLVSGAWQRSFVGKGGLAQATP